MTPVCNAAASDLLRKKVFGCEECANIADFRRPPGGGPFYKFPPIIGAQGAAPLLFIGINPRRSGSNQDLHEWLMRSLANFEQLSRNRDLDGNPYITPFAREGHCHCHATVVEEVFGRGTKFESKAAVTELFLCASETMPPSLTYAKSGCAQRFLSQVIAITKPKVIIAVGEMVKRHLHQHFDKTTGVPIIPMVHPRNLKRQRFQPDLRYQEMAERLQPTIEAIREVFGRSSDSIVGRA